MYIGDRIKVGIFPQRTAQRTVEGDGPYGNVVIVQKTGLGYLTAACILQIIHFSLFSADIIGL